MLTSEQVELYNKYRWQAEEKLNSIARCFNITTRALIKFGFVGIKAEGRYRQRKVDAIFGYQTIPSISVTPDFGWSRWLAFKYHGYEFSLLLDRVLDENCESTDQYNVIGVKSEFEFPSTLQLHSTDTLENLLAIVAYIDNIKSTQDVIEGSHNFALMEAMKDV